MKIETRKLAQLSMLAAACTAGRIIFQFIPNVQPMTAIFLFTVLYLGLKDALIVMSLSLIFSNLYFGMGPWIFGQWFSYSILLAAFSIVCRSTFIRHSFWLKGIFFFLSGILYGVGMTIADSILYQLPQPWVYYMQGLSFDMMHGIGNIVFYFVFLPFSTRFDRSTGGIK